MPSLIAQAAAPSVGALLIEQVGARGLLTALLGLGLVNAVLVAALLAFRRSGLRAAPG